MSFCNKTESLKELIDFTNLVSFAKRSIQQKLILLGKSLTYKEREGDQARCLVEVLKAKADRRMRQHTVVI